MSDLRLDGNAVAGELQELFAFEVTTARGRCAACGRAEPLGALHAYTRAPGLVLRCPHCGEVLATVVRTRSGRLLDLSGLRSLTFGPPAGAEADQPSA